MTRRIRLFAIGLLAAIAFSVTACADTTGPVADCGHQGNGTCPG